MRSFSAIVYCIGLLFAAECLGRAEPLANEALRGKYVKSLDQVLRLEPDQVDLGVAALIVAEEWSEVVHGRRYLARLDEMAYEIRARLEEKHLEPDYRAIGVINQYLFDEQGFAAVSEPTDPNDLFLHSVMDQRRGYCLSLSVLYLCLAERLGMPVYGVVVPGHFFVRYDDGRQRYNIETTSRGAVAPDKHYVKKFKVPQVRGESIYMKNLNKHETLGCLFNNLGNTYNDVGQIDTALEVLEAAVQINPSLAECRMNLGNIYLEKGRLSDAIFEYRQALKINPDDAKSHLNLGNAYSERGWLSDAIAEYTAARKLDGSIIDAYKNLASAYIKQDKLRSALGELQQALVIEPDDAGLYSRLGDVYMRMGSYDKAISLHKKALKMKPDLAEAYHGLGLCYNKLGLLDDEIEAYTKALAINGDMVGALVNLGNAYVAKKQYDAAIEQYERAVAIKPNDTMILYNFGTAYSNKGDYEGAVRLYEKAVALEPELGDAHNGLAYSYYNLKKYDLALKHAKKAKQLGVQVDPNLVKAIERQLH